VRIMVGDDSARLVTSRGLAEKPGASSPRYLIGTTIGDQMRLASNFQSKVVAVSLKDRSAVLPGGQRPNGAFWYSEGNGEFVSSDYYSKELPAWVKKFDVANKADKYFGMKWERILPAAAYSRAQAENLPMQKSPLGSNFPYVMTAGEAKPGPKFYNAFTYSPFASEYLEDFGKAALDAESLGADEFPDLLSISFSAPDLTGHAFGPDSQEIVDTYARLDRVIADLLSFVDKRVGLANTIIAVTGDHGVLPVPEYLKSKGYDAGRVASREVRRFVFRRNPRRNGRGPGRDLVDGGRALFPSTTLQLHWPLVALTVGVALVGVVLWGSLSGSMLPFVLRRVGADPATSSAPFVATLVDVTGLIIYFSIALLIMRGAML